MFHRRRFHRSLAAAAAGAAIVDGAGFSAMATATPITAAANCSSGYVALTFDDGPTSSSQSLVNALTSAGARATFFIWGNRISQYSSMLKAEANAGMWLGNHTWSHPNMTSLSSTQMASDITHTQNAIKSTAGVTPVVFRPPYGSTNSTLKSVESQNGLTEVLWTVDSQDWNGAYTAQIVSAAGNLQAGGIMLMHDGYSNTVNAVSQIVSNLNSR